MDLSKLPRMSQTPPPPKPAIADASQVASEGSPQAAHPYQHTNTNANAGGGAEAWLAIVLGVICLLLGMRFARWLMTTATGGTFQTGATWTTGDRIGQPVGYFELTGYPVLTEMAFFLFGLALLLEGLAIVATNSAGPGLRSLAITAALVVSAAATLFNLGVAGFLASLGTIPIVSLLMVAFGGYMTLFLFRLWRTLRGLSALA